MPVDPEEGGRNLLIFIPLALLLGFITTCCAYQCCNKQKVSDIELRLGEEDRENDSLDYSQLLPTVQ